MINFNLRISFFKCLIYSIQTLTVMFLRLFLFLAVFQILVTSLQLFHLLMLSFNLYLSLHSAPFPSILPVTLNFYAIFSHQILDQTILTVFIFTAFSNFLLTYAIFNTFSCRHFIIVCLPFICLISMFHSHIIRLSIHNIAIFFALLSRSVVG